MDATCFSKDYRKKLTWLWHSVISPKNGRESAKFRPSFLDPQPDHIVKMSGSNIGIPFLGPPHRKHLCFPQPPREGGEA